MAMDHAGKTISAHAMRVSMVQLWHGRVRIAHNEHALCKKKSSPTTFVCINDYVV